MTALPKIEPKSLERRRHQRVKVVLLGRYMLPDRQEYPCQSVDVSPGGVSLIAPVAGEIGDRVVCYFDQIGRIEGVIARATSNGFALAVNVPLMKREKLAEQLTWLANRHTLGMPEDRRHERIIPRSVRVTMTLGDGQERRAKIMDVSRSGAAILTEDRPPIGTAVTIGKTNAKVVRIFNTGIGVEFSRPFPPDEFDDTIIL